MKKIKLTKNKFAIVDDCDGLMLSQYSWYAHKNGQCWYAVTNINHGKWRGTITMHRLILGTVFTSNKIDHIDGDGLNNTRENLRFVTQHQNCQNRRINYNNKTGFKGVSPVARAKRKTKWMASIKFKGKSICLGTYKTAKEAGIAYNNAAIKYFGEFSKLNTIKLMDGK